MQAQEPLSQMSLRLQESVANQVKQIAEAEVRSENYVVVDLVRAGLAARTRVESLSQISVRFPQSVADQIKRIAAAEGHSTNYVVSELVRAQVAQRTATAPQLKARSRSRAKT